MTALRMALRDMQVFGWNLRFVGKEHGLDRIAELSFPGAHGLRQFFHSLRAELRGRGALFWYDLRTLGTLQTGERVTRDQVLQAAQSILRARAGVYSHQLRFGMTPFQRLVLAAIARGVSNRSDRAMTRETGP